MTATLGALLAERAGVITGRERERAQLWRLLEPDGPVVAYIHGLAGVGKSTLLHAFGADAREAGVACSSSTAAWSPRRASSCSRSAARASRRPRRRSARAATRWC